MGEMTMEWQPIETAPKDGERFFAATGSHIFVCQWGDHYLRGPDGKDRFGWVNADGQPGNTASPDRWLPALTKS